MAIDQNGASVAISFEITNVGNSPAINISPNAWLMVVKGGGPFPLQEQQRRCIEVRSRRSGLEFLFSPTSLFQKIWDSGAFSIGTNVTRDDLEKGARASTSKKQVLLYVIGCVDYTFASDPTTHHQTGVHSRSASRPVPAYYARRRDHSH